VAVLEQAVIAAAPNSRRSFFAFANMSGLDVCDIWLKVERIAHCRATCQLDANVGVHL